VADSADKYCVLGTDFYQRSDVVEISRDLLGKVLCTESAGERTSAIILETEAYAGESDKASHAFGGRRTRRTEPMYADGGIAYVYLCYGIHHLFNVVTNLRDIPQAVLIRAAAPLDGTDIMLERRGKSRVDRSLLGGPGSLSKALSIKTELTGCSLAGPPVWIEDRGISIDADAVQALPRVGIDYAQEDAARPYRFIAPWSWT